MGKRRDTDSHNTVIGTLLWIALVAVLLVGMAAVDRRFDEIEAQMSALEGGLGAAIAAVAGEVARIHEAHRAPADPGAGGEDEGGQGPGDAP